MYLASFEIEALRVRQGCVRLGPLPLLDDQVQERWWRTLAQQLYCAEAVTGMQQAMRIVLNSDRSIQRLLIVSAPPEAEVALRRYLASFTRLENVIAGSVGIPLSREEHDALLQGFPRRQYRSCAPAYSYANAWLACDLSVSSQLNALFAEADTLGHCLGYQVHIRQWRVDAESLREARKNALRVQHLSSIPEAVVEMQQRLVKGLDTAVALSEAFLAVETEEAARWLQNALQRDFHKRFAIFRFEVPEFEFDDASYDELLMLASHSSLFDDIPLDEICACAIDADGVVGMLGWRPSDELERRFASRVMPQSLPFEPSDESDVELVAPEQVLPPAYEGEGNFLFVSYRHQDVESIAPILHQLHLRGVHFWYDKGILGGTEWDAVIEQQLEQCCLVLVFLSQASVGSKYVRREVKYADVLNKPILTVQLEDTRLSHGMRMLLTQYQMLDVRAADFAAQLDRAMQSAHIAVSPSSGS